MEQEIKEGSIWKEGHPDWLSFYIVKKVTNCFVIIQRLYVAERYQKEERISIKKFLDYYHIADPAENDKARANFELQQRAEDMARTAKRKIEKFAKINPGQLKFEQNLRIVEILNNLYWDLYKEDL